MAEDKDIPIKRCVQARRLSETRWFVKLECGHSKFVKARGSLYTCSACAGLT